MQQIIETAWVSQQISNEVIEAIEFTLNQLDKGIITLCEHKDGVWHVQEWIKKAIILFFRFKQNKLVEGSYDKIPLKFETWKEEDFSVSNIRIVSGAKVRHSAYIGPRCVLMPCFINVGVHIGEGTMVDTWSTIGSCAYIGKNCHISGGVGIGGVLEPASANPVIIEDNVFVGARSEIAEGVLVEKGAVIGMGTFLGASTKIYNRQTKQITYGKVPANSVVVSGYLPQEDGISTYAAIIIKQVDDKTRSRTSINELLRGYPLGKE